MLCDYNEYVKFYRKYIFGHVNCDYIKLFVELSRLCFFWTR